MSVSNMAATYRVCGVDTGIDDVRAGSGAGGLVVDIASRSAATVREAS